MTADECHARASACAANAALAKSLPIEMEFLKMAAQWRAMAVKVIFLERLSPPLAALSALRALPLPPH